MRILAIDPGYERVGIAIVDKNKSGEKLVYSDCFKTSNEIPFPERLYQIGKEVSRIIEEFLPSQFAIETLMFQSNQKTAMGVAEAKGLMVYIAFSKRLEVHEYTPLQVKIAITGYGRSSKKQVMDMVGKMVSIPKKRTQDDEFDAIAIALTCSAYLQNFYPQLR